ncbi:hypothetical protein [Rhizobium brockwellii]
MATSLTLHMVNDELRVRDLELATAIGYGRSAKLRDLIRRNADELRRYGVLATVEKASDTEGGRSTEEFFLNEGQAVRVATLADMFDTASACEMVVKAYAEQRRSQRSALSPTPDLAAVLSILQHMAETVAYVTKHMVPR